MSRFVGTAVLSICLTAAAGIVCAQPHYAAQNDVQRHQWGPQEDKHWHDYLKERHKKDHDWAKASKREQKDYWKWRDQHPDAAR
jgi:hypothetical protein